MHEPAQPALDAAPPKANFPSAAWQPFTPRGIGAFAYARYWRLLLVQLIMGGLAAGTIVWFLSNAWFPVIRQAIQNLPEKGGIIRGELNPPEHNYAVLGEQRRPSLMFIVDVDNLSRGNSGADFSFRFHKHEVEACSLFGCAVYPYPKEYTIEFNRVELEPRWDAWRPSVVGWTAVLTPILLLVIWTVLALVYSPVAWLIGLIARRNLSWGGSWRLCSAALMPGALLLSAAVFLYGVGVLDLIHLLVAVALHLVVGWIFFVIATIKLPKRELNIIPPKANPFSDAPAPEPQKPKANPFAG
jgi:hypothetical protein